MRDVVIRRGVGRVIDDFRSSADLTEAEFERVFASGGGPPAVVGRDRDGMSDHNRVVSNQDLPNQKPHDLLSFQNIQSFGRVAQSGQEGR